MKNKIIIFTDEILQTTFFAYLVLIVMEKLKAGFVSDYLNPNYLLIVILVCFIIKIFINDGNEIIDINDYKKNRGYVILLDVIGGLYTYSYRSSRTIRFPSF